MSKDKTSQIIAVIALVIGIVSLSVGFAAFSNVLQIEPNATVTPSSDTLNVDFSSSDSEVLAQEITPVSTPTTIVATNAKIDNTNNPTISNLNATFTAPGQKTVYSFYAYNAGELDAYLKNIVYTNVSGNNNTKVCTPKEGTTEALVNEACNGIAVKVSVGNEAQTSSGIANISNHLLAKGKGEKVTVTLEYEADAARTDGDFTVSFGNITLNYSSVD